MSALHELLRLVRLANANLAVWHCERAVSSAKLHLAQALDARDQARAEIALHADGAPPLYLLAQRDAVVRTIKQRSK